MDHVGLLNTLKVQGNDNTFKETKAMSESSFPRIRIKKKRIFFKRTIPQSRIVFNHLVIKIRFETKKLKYSALGSRFKPLIRALQQNRTEEFCSIRTL